MSLKFNPITANFDLVNTIWGNPVANSGSLPASGQIGEIRIALDSKILYEWDGASWGAITTGISTGTQIDLFTLSAGDISNKYVILSNVPASASKVLLFIKSAPGQYNGDDYVVTGDDGGKRLSWDSLGLDGVLEAGDKLSVLYT